MAGEVVDRDTPPDLQARLKHVAGLDISWVNETGGRADTSGVAVLVVLRFPSMELVYQDAVTFVSDVPYVSGYLGFRENPQFLRLWDRMLGAGQAVPGVVLVDGFGTLHPAQCGSACMFGLAAGVPTVGVGKTINLGGCSQSDKQIKQELVDSGRLELPLLNGRQVVGTAVRKTVQHRQPVYVSVGHRVSLATATSIVRACLVSKIPEPIRQADLISREHIRLQGRDGAGGK